MLQSMVLQSDMTELNSKKQTNIKLQQQNSHCVREYKLWLLLIWRNEVVCQKGQV